MCVSVLNLSCDVIIDLPVTVFSVLAQFPELLAGDERRVNVGEGVIDGERTILVAKLGHVITDEILNGYKNNNGLFKAPINKVSFSGI